MKTPCATFSDTPHTVLTTKLSFITQNTTENWTTKSGHFSGYVNKYYSSILEY